MRCLQRWYLCKQCWCLELRNIKLSRLLDESLWVLVWYAGAPNDGKLSARRIFYQVVLSYLAEGSLEQAILASDDLRKEDEGSSGRAAGGSAQPKGGPSAEAVHARYGVTTTNCSTFI